MNFNSRIMKLVLASVLGAVPAIATSQANNVDWFAVMTMDPKQSEPDYFKPGWKRAIQNTACKPVDVLKGIEKWKRVAAAGSPVLELEVKDGWTDEHGKVQVVSAILHRRISGEGQPVSAEIFFRSRAACQKHRDELIQVLEGINKEQNSKYR